MPAISGFPKAFGVWFKNIARWDPSSFHGIIWHWPKTHMFPIGTVIKQRKEKVDRSKFNFSDLQPVTIHFDGSIDKRNVDSSREYRMDLYFAIPGDIVVAKIDLKNGAVAIVPEEWRNVVVTGHFAVYEPDRSRILPEFFHRIIQTSFFKDHLWRNKVGAEGRKEVKLDYFESLEIPLPPLPIQQTIIEKWRTTQDEIKGATERVNILGKKLAESALKEAGIELFPLEQRSKSFSIYWDEIERWGVEFNRWKWKLSELLLSHKYPMVLLSDEAFINPTDNVLLSDNDLVSFIPMEAVSDKTGEIEALQIRKCREVKNGYTRFSNDDVIWAKITPCMQNGKCAVARGLENGVGFGSTEFHVIRTKDKDKLMPDYIWTLLRLDHLRQAAQRYFIGSAGQQRVPADFLKNLQIPLPPVEIQRTLISSVKKAFSEIARERETAEKKSLEIKTEIEALMLGTKRIDVL
jgi:type I restriction enzyme S subunit